MSTAAQVINKAAISASKRSKSSDEGVIARFLKLMCSVRFGVALLILLGLACVIGMLVMQQNMDGFERYFQELTPSQRLVYSSLDFFDIYHSWYFNALLAVLSINIILASIDRWPKTWKFITDPPLTVPLRWLREQKQTAETTLSVAPDAAAVIVKSELNAAGWKKITEADKGGKRFILAQSGAWNRLGAYAVHVGLLTIFVGGFMTAQMGSTGQMALSPGTGTDLMQETVVAEDKTNEITKRLPFKVECIDIQQKLIKKDGPINAMNTSDWITRFRITDETGTHEATAQMNRPFDYRGYRFFQASFVPIARARSITVTANPASGGTPETLTIPRDGSAKLGDGTLVSFSEFRGNFRIGPEDPNEDTSNFENPAAVLRVTAPGDTAQTAYAFGGQMANIPVAGKPVAGYTYQLTDYEKASDKHILSVQRDPGATVVYIGFALLVLTLIAVFFFSHQRVWAAIEPSEHGSLVVLGGFPAQWDPKLGIHVT